MAVQLDVGQPVLLGPGEGEAATDRDERTVLIVCEHELLDVTWSRYARGERGPDAHIHKQHADAFYVLAGEVVFELGPGGEKVPASEGTLVLVPAGVIHSFGNEGTQEAFFLNVHAPS